MSIDIMATSPSSLNKEDLSFIASSSTSLLSNGLLKIFKALNIYDTLLLNDSLEANGVFSRTYLAKLETQNSEAASLFITIVSQTSIDPTQADNLIASISKALEKLPCNYQEWVIMRTRYILVNFDDNKTLNSQSSPKNPDTIRISGNPSPHCISEMIIHEASHLHYYATVLSEKVTHNHAPEVYSAFMRRNRPLERVIFAYHAACNISSVLEVNTPKYNHELRAIQDKKLLAETISKNEEFLTFYGKKLVAALP